MPDVQIAAYAAGIVLLIGAQAVVARGFRGDVRQIVQDLMAPVLIQVEQLKKDLDNERAERRKGDEK